MISKYKKFKIYCVFFTVVFLTVTMIIFISGYFSTRVDYYIAQKVKLQSSFLFEQAIRDAVIPNVDINSILILKYSEGEEKKIDNVIVNTKEVNSIMSKTLEVINDLFLQIENGIALNELILPLGVVISDTLFQNMGPNIKIKVRPVGSYKVDLITSAESFGINNSILQVLLTLQIDFITIIPFNSQVISVDLNIPLVIEFIQGVVPRYYYYLHNYDPGPSIPEIE